MTMAAESLGDIAQSPVVLAETYALDWFEQQTHKGERVNNDGTLHIITPAASPDRIGPDHLSPLSLNFLQNRFEFVQQQGWLPDAVDDWDRYDEDPQTQYVIKSNPNNPDKMWTGMRLTKVDDVFKSLSWEMMNGNPALQAQAIQKERFMFNRLANAAEQGELYDLTRLTLNFYDEHEADRLPWDKINESFREVFGAGVEATTKDGVAPTWLFVTSASFLKHLNAMGIPTDEIVRGKLSPTDKEDCVMSIACPEAVLAYAKGVPYKKEYQDTYNVVTAAANSFTD